MQSSNTGDILSKLEKELHDLAQPISSLQCRLEIGKMLGGQDALQEAVEGGLKDLSRMTEILTNLRVLITEGTRGRA